MLRPGRDLELVGDDEPGDARHHGEPGGERRGSAAGACARFSAAAAGARMSATSSRFPRPWTAATVVTPRIASSARSARARPGARSPRAHSGAVARRRARPARRAHSTAAATRSPVGDAEQVAEQQLAEPRRRLRREREDAAEPEQPGHHDRHADVRRRTTAIDAIRGDEHARRGRRRTAAARPARRSRAPAASRG